MTTTDRSDAPDDVFAAHLAGWEAREADPEDASWDEFVERNQDEWREEADALLAFLDGAS